MCELLVICLFLVHFLLILLLLFPFVFYVRAVVVKPSDDEGKLTERDDPSPPSFPFVYLLNTFFSPSRDKF